MNNAFKPIVIENEAFFNQICELMRKIIYYLTDDDDESNNDFKQQLYNNIIKPFCANIKENNSERYLNFVYDVSERIFKLEIQEFFIIFYGLLEEINKLDLTPYKINLYDLFFETIRIAFYYTSIEIDFDTNANDCLKNALDEICKTIELDIEETLSNIICNIILSKITPNPDLFNSLIQLLIAIKVDSVNILIDKMTGLMGLLLFYENIVN